MKPVTILAIIVGVVVVVGAILFIDQNNQIVMMKNQKMFEDEIRWCSAEYVFDTAKMERCFLNAFETYGTQEQLDAYLQELEDERKAENQKQQETEWAERMKEENCIKTSIGSSELFDRCMGRPVITDEERMMEEYCREKSIGSSELFESCMRNLNLQLIQKYSRQG